MSQMHWTICNGCLKYFPLEKAVKKGFCSETCIREYNLCYTCGKYFEKRKGFQENYCSEICTNKYQIKKDGRFIEYTTTDEN